MVVGGKSNVVYPSQIIGLFYITLIMGFAIQTFLFVKIPFIRKLIDDFLGLNFVSFHGINTFAKLCFNCSAAIVGALAIKHGDNFLTTLNNAHELETINQKLISSNLPTLTRQEIITQITKPSMTQNLLDGALKNLNQGIVIEIKPVENIIIPNINSNISILENTNNLKK
jgi:hypothetical protein